MIILLTVLLYIATILVIISAALTIYRQRKGYDQTFNIEISVDGDITDADKIAETISDALEKKISKM